MSFAGCYSDSWNLAISCDVLPRRRTGSQLLHDKMLRYDQILKFALIPSIIFFFISLVSVALTTHYWILTDWVVPRGVKVVTGNFNDRLQQYETDDTIIYFKEAPTDATIVSGCLNLTAAVVALIAWSTLRKPDMDSQYNIVRIPMPT